MYASHVCRRIPNVRPHVFKGPHSPSQVDGLCADRDGNACRVFDRIQVFRSPGYPRMCCNSTHTSSRFLMRFIMKYTYTQVCHVNTILHQGRCCGNNKVNFFKKKSKKKLRRVLVSLRVVRLKGSYPEDHGKVRARTGTVEVNNPHPPPRKEKKKVYTKRPQRSNSEPRVTAKPSPQPVVKSIYERCILKNNKNENKKGG